MRARFTDRIRELRRTFTESAAALERAAERARDGTANAWPRSAELAEIETLRGSATSRSAGGRG